MCTNQTELKVTPVKQTDFTIFSQKLPIYLLFCDYSPSSALRLDLISGVSRSSVQLVHQHIVGEIISVSVTVHPQFYDFINLFHNFYLYFHIVRAATINQLID